MNRMLKTLEALNRPMYVMTGEGLILRRPGSRNQRETLLVTIATVAAIVTVLVMIVGCVMLAVTPWSTPEPPISVELVMTGLPATTMVIAAAAAFASRSARDPLDVLTEDDIRATPPIMTEPFLDAWDAARTIRVAEGLDGPREREIGEILWQMAEHLKAGTGLYSRLPDISVEQIVRLQREQAAKMRVLADRLTALAAEVATPRLRDCERA